MLWFVDLCDTILKKFNELFDFINTNIDALGGSPLAAISTGLIVFISAMLILRIVRG